MIILRVKIGLIGKTNTGKTTFFNSSTLQSSEISNYPFTTKAPNSGAASAITLCVHKEFHIEDNPKNSECKDGWRLIPVEITDLPGLIKGASRGKGLGTQFLATAAQSDVLLHVIDTSGSIDMEGKITEPGSGDPVADIGDIEEELAMWYLRLLEGNRDNISRNLRGDISIDKAMSEVFMGIGVKGKHIRDALNETNLDAKHFENWTDKQDLEFSWVLRDISKPTLIIANKMDLHTSTENFKRVQDAYHDMIVVPASAEAELTLRRASEKGLILYRPGEERFQISGRSNLNDKQKWALDYIQRTILGQFMRTGVQFAINIAVFKLLRMNTVYPVSDAAHFADKRGNVLPDVFLLPSGDKVTDLAEAIHSDLAKGLLYAVDARSGIRLPSDYELKDRDILSIISSSKKKS